jgi:hypothetical protein
VKFLAIKLLDKKKKFNHQEQNPFRSRAKKVQLIWNLFIRQNKPNWEIRRKLGEPHPHCHSSLIIPTINGLIGA